MSLEAKELLRQMLHIVPQRRPTANQILRNQWLWQPPNEMRQTNMYNPTSSGMNSVPTTSAAIKGAVNATFRAIACSPQAANLGPVDKSELAKRRAKDKMLNSS